ncbi:flagellar hook-length control protein FliK [bacterium]|nr:flagellar hook-length control protein FliK [bacterium]MBU1073040.1 flagellar hook-length control protein FliK [bacterium]MBU1674558.1 flagellar hook-length control protein FliK [bacterium]
MNGVGSAGAFVAAREAHEKNRSDIAVAVAIAADQGGFARMLGAERKNSGERSEERPRDAARSETDRQPAETRPAARRAAPRDPGAVPGRKTETKADDRSSPDKARRRAATDAGPGQRSATRTGVASTTRQPAAAQLPGSQALLNRAAVTTGSPVAARTPAATVPGPATEGPLQAHGAAPQVSPAQATDSARAGVASGGPEPAQIDQGIQTVTVDAAVQQLSEAIAQADGQKPSSGSLPPGAAQPEIPAQLAEQVRAQVVTQLAGKLGGLGGKGSLRLTLSPPELGRVEIRFTRVGARLQLTFQVESAAAARALQDGTGHLQELLLGSKSPWQQIEVVVVREDDEAEEQDEKGRGRRSRRDDEERDARNQDEQGG